MLRFFGLFFFIRSGTGIELAVLRLELSKVINSFCHLMFAPQFGYPLFLYRRLVLSGSLTAAKKSKGAFDLLLEANSKLQ
jgi:hypothetical protein